MIIRDKLSSMQSQIQCSHCGVVAAVPQREGLNNGEAESPAAMLERRVPGVNQVVSMEHARVRLARQKTVAIETLLPLEYLEELIKWMEEARAG